MLCDDWMKRRQLLAALGVEEVDKLDDLLTSVSDQPEPVATEPAARAAQVAAFVAAAGGL